MCGLIEGTRSAFFPRENLETADLTGNPRTSIFGPVNYRPVKELGSPGLIAEPPKHRTGIARNRLAIPVHINSLESDLLEAGQFTLSPHRGLLSSQPGQWKTDRKFSTRPPSFVPAYQFSTRPMRGRSWLRTGDKERHMNFLSWPRHWLPMIDRTPELLEW